MRLRRPSVGVLWGVTAWAIPGLAAAVATDYVGPRMVHPAMALVNVVGSVGQMSGPVVSGYAVDRTSSFVPGLLLTAAAALLGSALARSLGARGEGDPGETGA